MYFEDHQGGPTRQLLQTKKTKQTSVVVARNGLSTYTTVPGEILNVLPSNQKAFNLIDINLSVGIYSTLISLALYTIHNECILRLLTPAVISKPSKAHRVRA